MARLILITGGCRSGKSAHGQRLAERFPGRRAFIATCPLVDDEMRQRIRRHQQAREAAHWQTIEEPLNLDRALAAARQCEVVLVDCLTLWVSNLMYEAEQRGAQIEEEEMARRGVELLESCRSHPGTVILITNEVGMGIVPENGLARRYRDLIGQCNQTIAAGADAVALAEST
jgi:adenosylcobinamide kinase/adenosylcobinamide-phosphate guanylyltransferase